MESTYKTLKTAYINFGMEGPKSLVSGLKQSGFNNQDELLEQLIRKHLINSEIFLLACERELTTFPDIFQIITQFPETIRFNKQVYLHRSNPAYNELFMRVTKLTPGHILSAFIDYYRLSSIEDAVYLITICLESWFSKIDINQIDAEKMFHQFDKLVKTILLFKESVELNDMEI